MSFLKRLSDKTDSKLIIKDMLHARLGGAEPARGQERIHASDLTKMDNQWGDAYCPREVRLRELVPNAPKRRDQFLQVATEVTFAEGRDKQRRLNEDWLADVMWGDWVCNSCYEARHWQTKPDYPCPDCGAKNSWRYEEPRVIDHYSQAAGGIDAVVDVGKPKLVIIECKIMKSDDFKTLHAPLAEHRVRTKLYLRLIAGSHQPFTKNIETDYAHILYIMRGHGIKQEDGRISPFKEFIVERDDDEIQHYVGMAHALTLSREHEGLYPAGICKTQMDDRAKKCPFAKECFSAKFAGNTTWLKHGTPVHSGDRITTVTDGEEVHECSS